MACQFDAVDQLTALLRPRSEEPYEPYLSVTLNPFLPRPNVERGSPDPRLAGATLAESYNGFFSLAEVGQTQGATHFQKPLRGFEERHRIWDIAWTAAGELTTTHDNCLCESWDAAGHRISFSHGRQDEHGVQLIRWRGQDLVSVIGTPRSRDVERRLCALDGSTVLSFDRDYLISVDEHDRLLCRDVSFSRSDARRELVFNADGVQTLRADLGQFDCFNHSLRIDGDEGLWFLRGNPTLSHFEKVLCRVTKEGTVEEVMPWDAAGEPHLTSGAALRVGENLIRSYEVHTPRADSLEVYLESTAIGGSPHWRVQLDALVTDMVLVRGVLVLAQSDGRLAVLSVESGETLSEVRASVAGVPTVVQSLAALDGRVGAGTICGNVLLVEPTL